ncbi:hypothetical protein PUN28_013249 [Cardiocondyla obscurior]|uniref:Uncharacterized protein n=1 Tax=Cardiocondyla obscurior TaxID=286306 RepID=A0AAW2F8W0_9HYME
MLCITKFLIISKPIFRHILSKSNFRLTPISLSLSIYIYKFKSQMLRCLICLSIERRAFIVIASRKKKVTRNIA